MAREIVFVVARDLGNGIGKGNALPWRLPSDLQNFKVLTTGHVILMGRLTAESLKKPLPNRINIVLSQSGFTAEGFSVFTSVNDALATFPNEDIYVIGGAQLYKLLLPIATKIVLTEVQTSVDADTYFDWQPGNEWEMMNKSEVTQNERDEYSFITKTYWRRGGFATERL